jgi:hypothetical protein
MPSAFLPVLGPIVAATIAGAVAFLASVFSKEQKTSEFRQAWIDALRNDLSELISIALQIGDEILVRHKRDESTQAIQAHLRTKESEFQRLEACKTRIRLRLNPKEHQVLLDAVKAMSDPSDHDTKSEALIAESQRVLKAEWKRVKRGEPVFFVTKWLSLIVCLTALGIAISMVWGKISVSYVP